MVKEAKMERVYCQRPECGWQGERPEAMARDRNYQQCPKCRAPLQARDASFFQIHPPLKQDT